MSDDAKLTSLVLNRGPVVGPAIADQVIEYLRGTCKSTYDAANEFDIDDDQVLEIVVEADEIDQCGECGWWCENSELEEVDGELVCEGCRGDAD